MNRIAVASSAMVSAGYDEAARVLEIEFRSRAVYQYLDVGPETYADFLHASSKGRFFHDRIQDRFKYCRL